jgi:hypothetical protein
MRKSGDIDDLEGALEEAHLILVGMRVHRKFLCHREVGEILQQPLHLAIVGAGLAGGIKTNGIVSDLAIEY